MWLIDVSNPGGLRRDPRLPVPVGRDQVPSDAAKRKGNEGTN